MGERISPTGSGLSVVCVVNVRGLQYNCVVVCRVNVEVVETIKEIAPDSEEIMHSGLGKGVGQYLIE